MAKRHVITERDSGLVLYQWVEKTDNDHVFHPEYEIIDGSGREPLAKFDEDERDHAEYWIEGYEKALEDMENGEL